MTKRQIMPWVWGGIALLAAIVVFVIPFAFIVVTASKTADEALALQFTWPTKWVIWKNITEVLSTNDFMLVRAFTNSMLLTVFSVTGVVVLCSVTAYIIVRRHGRLAKLANGMLLAGLIIPPALVPTIFVMQGLGIYGSFPGMVFIEIAFNASFAVMIFKSFIASIPRELDEAAIIDGAGPIRLYFQVVFPLLKSVTVTVIILTSVFVFNDFTNPLYFMNGPGAETIQLTLYNFTSQFQSNYNLLFMDILLITVPMVILFAIFNRRIVAGMTAGSVKG
ncbi:MAG: carbohydrate ABC transporter permease [Micrococcales bacterium]